MAVSVLAGCGGGSSTGGSASSTAASSGSSSGSVADDPAVVLTMAEVNPLDTIVGQMDQKFAEEVERLSGGSVTIDLQASGVLGAENVILDSMLGGGNDIDISRISAFALTSYGCTKATMLSLPYTFSDRDHFWAFAESDLAQEFLNEPEELGLGVRGLFYGEEGFRHFFTVDPVTGIESFKNMKLRVSSDPVMVGLVQALGAYATNVDFTELYSALQTGVVDGAEQPIANYQSNAFPEVAPNIILDGHTLGAVQVIISDNAWNKLTEAQQEAVVEAGKLASQYCREMSEEKENEVLEQLKKDGVNIVEVDDKTPWQEATADVIAENTKGNEDLYQQILDFGK